MARSSRLGVLPYGVPRFTAKALRQNPNLFLALFSITIRIGQRLIPMALPVQSIRRPRILIAGIGNLLSHDDGVGAHAIKWLRRRRWPRNVWVAELIHPALGSARLIDRADAVLAIYSMPNGGRPGDLHLHTLSDRPPAKHPASLHEFTLISSLEFLSQPPPPVWVLGVEPDSACSSVGVSPAVSAAMPGIEQAVRDFIAEVSTKFDAASLSKSVCLGH